MGYKMFFGVNLKPKINYDFKGLEGRIITIGNACLGKKSNDNKYFLNIRKNSQDYILAVLQKEKIENQNLQTILKIEKGMLLHVEGDGKYEISVTGNLEDMGDNNMINDDESLSQEEIIEKKIKEKEQIIKKEEKEKKPIVKLNKSKPVEESEDEINEESEDEINEESEGEEVEEVEAEEDVEEEDVKEEENSEDMDFENMDFEDNEDNEEEEDMDLDDDKDEEKEDEENDEDNMDNEDEEIDSGDSDIDEEELKREEEIQNLLSKKRVKPDTSNSVNDEKENDKKEKGKK